MLSFTSSSRQRLPDIRWRRILFGGLLIAGAFIALMEARLAIRGFKPDVPDSERLWAQQRDKASEFGSRALILVGASRIQLDIDLDVLRKRTGLEPEQLAIDGTSFVPVLASLAHDPKVTGTVLVSFLPHVIAEWSRHDAAVEYLRNYERLSPHWAINAESSETFLGDWVHAHLRSYADGASPLSSLVLRILVRHPTPQYVRTLPDRSRLADYKLAPMPGMYYARVVRELGIEPRVPPNATYAQLDSAIRTEISLLGAEDAHAFRDHLGQLQEYVHAIQARGGRVIFVYLPTSGLVHEIWERRYPRKVFWGSFVRSTSATTLDAEEVPGLREFTCPDGSHLDFRDRAQFTSLLIAALRGSLAERTSAATPASVGTR